MYRQAEKLNISIPQKTKPKPIKPPSPISFSFYLKVHLNIALTKLSYINFSRIFPIFNSPH